MEYLYLIIGLIILIVSGELLLKGAVGIALRFSISTLVVGMTIVSFGTSAPELLVSVNAALNNHPDISIGNVIGSNIANIAFILGITALIFPLKVEEESIRINWPLMMGASLLLYFLALDNELNWVEGLLFVVLLIVISVWLIRKSRKKEFQSISNNEDKEQKPAIIPFYKSIAFVVLGCIGLAFGANWFLEGAIEIANKLGVSERIIGITLVAFGTSVPELITSVVAAFRKQIDISIGNLIGSNLFNILGILGITSILAPINIDEKILTFDMFWMLGISLLIFPFMIYKRKITRIKGFLLLIVYLIYIGIVLVY